MGATDGRLPGGFCWRKTGDSKDIYDGALGGVVVMDFVGIAAVVESTVRVACNVEVYFIPGSLGSRCEVVVPMR